MSPEVDERSLGRMRERNTAQVRKKEKKEKNKNKKKKNIPSHLTTHTIHSLTLSIPSVP
jgi:hypothetical protein